ncbi:hypothetical protein [Adhaeribacter rhizoryzae]|uniref:Uncharacterized protein n=1 Tax=Adhaeribacter rhizoryzae TaxID=2607907 RepID=A0A5M6DQ78_9BACT|nr:hypothetical protein [Adhaeribacter rhizoryzae]KAA5548379.1 hypothetical protein F0145_06535 [Adhaeribacter rhizoryzae]
MEIIVTSAEQLSRLIREEISRLQDFRPAKPPRPDHLDFKEALKFVNEQGFPLSRSQFYKSTSLKQVPFKTFGRKLIFSRLQLLDWIESKTIDKNETSLIELALARSARKKKGAKNV